MWFVIVCLDVMHTWYHLSSNSSVGLPKNPPISGQMIIPTKLPVIHSDQLVAKCCQVFLLSPVHMAVYL